MVHVEVKRHYAAPPEVVFDRYTDHVSWTQWSGMGKVTLARKGDPPPNGVGCVRSIKTAGVGVEEEVLTFERPRRMTYQIVRGLVPMKDHLGEVLFAPEDGGTLVTWRCRFNSVIPGMGGAQRWFITRLFRAALEGLAKDLAVA